MREIVVDIETTGLDPKKGDKIIEIACLELINHIPTDKYFHENLIIDSIFQIDAYRDLSVHQ